MCQCGCGGMGHLRGSPSSRARVCFRETNRLATPTPRSVMGIPCLFIKANFGTLLSVGLLYQTLDTKVSRTIERANNRQRTLVSQGYHQVLLMSRLAKGRFCRPFLSFPLFHKNISRATTQKRQPVTPQDSSKQDRTKYGIPNKQRHGNCYQPRQ